MENGRHWRPSYSWFHPVDGRIQTSPAHSFGVARCLICLKKLAGNSRKLHPPHTPIKIRTRGGAGSILRLKILKKWLNVEYFWLRVTIYREQLYDLMILFLQTTTIFKITGGEQAVGNILIFTRKYLGACFFVWSPLTKRKTIQTWYFVHTPLDQM